MALSKDMSTKRMVLVGVTALLIVAMVIGGLLAVRTTQTTQSEASGGLCAEKGYIDQDSGGACPVGTEPVSVELSSTATGSGPEGSTTTVQCCKLIAGGASGDSSATSTTDNSTTNNQIATNTINSGDEDSATATTSTTTPDDSTTTPDDSTTTPDDSTTNTSTTPSDSSTTNNSDVLKACPASAALNVTISCLGCNDNAR